MCREAMCAPPILSEEQVHVEGLIKRIVIRSLFPGELLSPKMRRSMSFPNILSSRIYRSETASRDLNALNSSQPNSEGKC